MDSKTNIVVTGLGVVTPIGIGIPAYWESLLNGINGVQIREDLAQMNQPLKLYAPVDDFDGKQWVRPRKALKVMCRPIQFGYAAASSAIEQSKILESGINPDRLGTVFGSETFFSDPKEVADVFRKCVFEKNYDHDRWGEFAIREIQPLWMLKYLPNMVSSHISIMADARGPSNSICQGSVSGLLALIEGAELIRRGVCDAVIVGGTGEQTALSSVLCRGQDSISTRFDEPENACRPFDLERVGTVFGEGAGAMVIENEAVARKRGVRPLVTLKGWNRGFVPPDSKNADDAIAINISETLQNSHCSKNEISHFNANAGGHAVADSIEARAIRATLGDVPVVAIKSFFGNLGSGSSIVELIASILSLNHSTIPPTRNFETPDPNCPVNVNVAAKSIGLKSAIKLSFAGTGQIASVCFGDEN